MTDWIIKNGYVVDPLFDISEKKEIYITRGKIASNPSRLAKIIDARGALVCPGLIDLHVHLREPGQEEKETIASGSLAAAKGGFTSICCMPNTDPPLDSPSAIAYVRNRAKETAQVNVLPIAAITTAQQGHELVEMSYMAQEGAIAFSDDGHWVADAHIMRRAVEYATMLNAVIISHAEDVRLSAGGVMNEGLLSTRLGLKPIPATAESTAVARDVLLAGAFGRIHFAHVSTRASITLIKAAKKKGLPITAETAPHYFCLTEEAVDGYNTAAKVNPPLRASRDVGAIIRALADGTIDAIATDHAPHTFDDKNVPFDQAAFGISGLETAFATSYTYLVKSGKLSLKQLIAKFTSAPRNIIKLANKGSLQIGNDADLVIIDLDKQWTVDAAQFLSKGKNTPFQGQTLFGLVEKTMVGGKIIYEL